MIKKRHFYNNKEYTIDEKEKVVRLSPAFHQKLLEEKLWGRFGFKKIGGSSIGEILLVDQWKSQFAGFCRIAWIGLPILDRKYVDAGIAIEPKVLEVISQVMKQPVKGFPAEKYQYDYFKGKDKIIGGLPDGLLEKEGKVLEIKTTGEKNYEKWEQWGVPVAYRKQAALYTYLMGLKKYAIVATFLKEEDYADPSQYPIRERKLKSYNYTIKKSEVEDDIAKVKEWYKEFTEKGFSPKYDAVKDQELLEYLKCSTPEEWEELLQKWRDEGKIPNE